MGKARNLSVLLAADGQVEDAKIDGLTSSKLTGDLPALSAANLTSIPAANITGTLPAISGANLTGVVAVSGVATDATKLPLAGGALTGAVTTNSTFDGRDVAADGVTADAALPKAGGAMTGAITTNSTFDGRDVGVDGTKLDGIEANATADLTNEEIQDVVGGMVTSNTESGITVTYQDSDGTLDFTVASQTDENFTTADHSKLDGIEANATADQTGAQIKTAYEAETNAFTDAQFTKLSNIETAATADQTGAQIKTLYQAETNAFTDAQFTKLSNIETAATADQTAAQIKTAYESNSDTNAYNDAAVSKLAAIEASATADQTDEEIQDIVGAMVASNTETGITVTYQDSDGTLDFAVASQTANDFTNTLKAKLDAIEASADVTDTTNVVAALSAGTGVAISGAGAISVTAVALTTVQTAANQTAHLALTAQEGDIVVRSDENKTYCHNGGSAGSMADYTLLATPTDTVLSVAGNTGAVTAAQIKTAYESNSNSNEFSDAEQTKLSGIETSATADQTGAQIKTLYQAESSAFTDAQFTKLAGIETSAKDDQTGAQIKTLYQAETNAFTDAQFTKLAGIETSATADQTGAQIKTLYEAESNAFTDTKNTKLAGIATSANLYVHPNHSGEVTSTADGATVIADNVVDEANLKISNSPTNGQFLSAQSGNTGGLTWAAVDALPSQSGNSGKFLTTNATTASWATVDALPSQGGNAGKYLTTDATNASWATLDTDANTTTKGLYEHSHTITANYAMTAGNNALTAGPITINSGITVTVPSGSTWVIA